MVRAGEHSLEDVSKRLEDLVYDIEAKSLTVDLPKVPDERWLNSLCVILCWTGRSVLNGSWSSGKQ